MLLLFNDQIWSLVISYCILYSARVSDGFLTCKFRENGSDYSGNQNRSITGKQCLNWIISKAQMNLTKDQLNIPSFSTSYCRNPNGVRKSPWCFVSATQWEYCHVPLCKVNPAMDLCLPAADITNNKINKVRCPLLLPKYFSPKPKIHLCCAIPNKFSPSLLPISKGCLISIQPQRLLSPKYSLCPIEFRAKQKINRVLGKYIVHDCCKTKATVQHEIKQVLDQINKTTTMIGSTNIFGYLIDKNDVCKNMNEFSVHMINHLWNGVSNSVTDLLHLRSSTMCIYNVKSGRTRASVNYLYLFTTTLCPYETTVAPFIKMFLNLKVCLINPMTRIYNHLGGLCMYSESADCPKGYTNYHIRLLKNRTISLLSFCCSDQRGPFIWPQNLNKDINIILVSKVHSCPDVVGKDINIVKSSKIIHYRYGNKSEYFSIQGCMYSSARIIDRNSLLFITPSRNCPSGFSTIIKLPNTVSVLTNEQRYIHRLISLQNFWERLLSINFSLCNIQSKNNNFKDSSKINVTLYSLPNLCFYSSNSQCDVKFSVHIDHSDRWNSNQTVNKFCCILTKSILSISYRYIDSVSFTDVNCSQTINSVDMIPVQCLHISVNRRSNTAKSPNVFFQVTIGLVTVLMLTVLIISIFLYRNYSSCQCRKRKEMVGLIGPGSLQHHVNLTMSTIYYEIDAVKDSENYENNEDSDEIDSVKYSIIS